MIKLVKKLYRYLEKLTFALFKIRQHVSYTLAFSELRHPEHKIREVAHSIDKSLAMKNPDPSRGKKARNRLDNLCNAFDGISQENQLLIKRIKSPLRSDGFDADLELPTIRRFLNAEIDMKIIERSINKANKYPKSCSREAVKVFLVENNKNLASDCFSGFSCIEGNYHLSIIVVDLTAYDSRAEIFAPYIDGAIFATGYCESLWEDGIGSCMLNWSSQKKQDELTLRSLLNLKKYELIVMGIVLGHPEFVPFHAPRKKVEEILTVL